MLGRDITLLCLLCRWENFTDCLFRPDPGFVGGGQTTGGASEFVIPNGPIPSGATITVVRPR
ncbi:MAG TPA: polymorphic toxin type 10 domain-containing protein [Candidatus Angelobacter sp.]|nr:polymorphic toxin type 10 domain-containing protein [Candidatus Angelobacter sp.]